MLLVQLQYVLNTHSTVLMYVLAVASSCSCFAAAAAIYNNSNNQQQQQRLSVLFLFGIISVNTLLTLFILQQGID